MKKLMYAIAALASILFAMATLTQAFSTDATVTVNSMCGIDAIGSLTFNSLRPSQTSESEFVVVNNSGDFTARIYAFGTDWCTGNTQDNGMCMNPTTPSMPVSSTGVSNDGGNAWIANLQYATNPFQFGSLEPNTIMNAYFRVTIPAKQLSGSYKQVITFTAICQGQ
jgi:hypothetical protein